MTTTKRTMIAIGAAVLVAIAAAVPADAAAYMKLGSIKGESQDKDHKDWIIIESFSHGATRWREGAPAPSASAPSGREDAGTLTVSKKYDKSSPSLSQACANGKSMGKVEVHLCTSAEAGECQQYMAYHLQNARVSSYNLSNTRGRAVEELHISYRQVDWEFVTRAEGDPDRPVIEGRRVPARPRDIRRADDDD